MKCKYLSQDHSELVETLGPRPLKILYIAKKSQHLICDWPEVSFELHVASVTNKLPSTEALAPVASVFNFFFKAYRDLFTSRENILAP